MIAFAPILGMPLSMPAVDSRLLILESQSITGNAWASPRWLVVILSHLFLRRAALILRLVKPHLEFNLLAAIVRTYTMRWQPLCLL